MNVHILITVLRPENLPTALLVFKTVRRGFPKASVCIYGNGVRPRSDAATALARTAAKVGVEYRPIQIQAHGEWIEKLLAAETEPFWICDSDVVFFDRVEHWFESSPDVLFAGRYEPEFWEAWTKTVHVARLHPSLMWFNPAPLRAAMRLWPVQNEFFSTVQSNLVQWNWVPEAEKPLKFYDTCAGLHHALGGQRFSEEQNQAYEHLFCGSYADLISDSVDLRALHQQAVADPLSVRGLWRKQQEWYEANKCASS